MSVCDVFAKAAHDFSPSTCGQVCKQAALPKFPENFEHARARCCIFFLFFLKKKKWQQRQLASVIDELDLGSSKKSSPFLDNTLVIVLLQITCVPIIIYMNLFKVSRILQPDGHVIPTEGFWSDIEISAFEEGESPRAFFFSPFGVRLTFLVMLRPDKSRVAIFRT